MTRFQLLPRLHESEVRELTASIEQFGVKVPVVVDEDGEIIDGHHRQTIADSLEIECPRVVERGLSDPEKRILAAQLNAARRQMTDAQKVLLGKAIEPDIAAVAEKRRLATQNNKTAEGLRSSGQLSGTGETRDEVARTVGIGSGRTYERGSQVVEELEAEPDGDQLVGHLRSGDWQLDDARQELRTRRREAERKQAATVQADLEAVMPADSRDDLQRARIRSIVSTAIHHVGSNLTPLNPEAVAAAMDADRRYQMESFIQKTRAWFDAVEAEMGHGIRVVHRKDA